MTLVEAFKTLVMMLMIEPASDRVDELLAELVTQAALNLHQSDRENLMIRCVRWDNPNVYYALDQLLEPYAFTLTAKPGPAKGTVILGIQAIDAPDKTSEAKSPKRPTSDASGWTTA